MTDETAPIQNDQVKDDRGPSVILRAAPPDLKVDRTFLIDIADPSPARLAAHMKYFEGPLAADKIVDAFKDANGWGAITPPEPGSPPANIRTRLDLDVSRTGHKDFALVVFKLSGGGSFLTYDGTPQYAVTGALGGRDVSQKFLFEPTWVSDGTGAYNIVRLVAGKGDYKTLFNLGILITDSCDATYQTPIFLDPKIEDSGGR